MDQSPPTGFRPGQGRTLRTSGWEEACLAPKRNPVSVHHPRHRRRSADAEIMLFKS